MKLIFLLSLFTVLQMNASVFSQNEKISVNLNNSTIKDVLDVIENEFGYKFIYSDDLVNANEKVSIDVDKKNIEDAIQIVLNKSSYSYKVLEDKLVVIYPSQSAKQGIEIKGKVIDISGVPLPGVNVLEKGTTNGAVTDLNGKFTITVSSENAVLVFSYVGFLTEEFELNGNSNLDITLVEDIQSLEEVVVVGYGVQRKKDLTTSVSSVSSEDFAERPITQIGQAMAGLATGVQVTENSGKPGSGLSIRVRGATSINANNDPLYVIDGVPASDISSIAVEDIESMQVLKDASAAAIYGSRGANGVVLITTKRGKENTAKMSFSTYHGVSQLPKKIDVLNAQQYAELINESQINAGGTPRYDNPTSVKDVTDWQDEVYRNAPVSQYRLAFTGGSEKTQYYLSLNMIDQEGIIDPSQFKRYSIKANLDQEIYDWLKVGTNLSWSKINSHNVEDNSSVTRGGVVLGALSTPPTIPIYNEDGTFAVNPFQAWENPVAGMKGTEEGTKANHFLGNVFAEATILKDLVFKSSLGLESKNSTWSSFTDPYRTGSGRAYKGLGSNSTNIDFTWLTENTFTYTKELGNHKVSALAGATAQQHEWNNTYQYVQNFGSAEIPTLNAGTVSVDNTTDASEWTMASFIGRITYNFQSKYLVTANIRRDGSSRFGKKNRWGTFPSLSAGWRVSDESFMEGTSNVINDMKVRVSWGMNGNQPSDAYAAFGKVTPRGGYPFGDELLPGVRQNRASNDSLKWETTEQLNAGLDINLFESRIQIIADVYFKKTKDLLMNVNVATQMGVASQLRNVGNVENKGFELGISTRNLTGAFRWDTDLNLSMNRNKVKNLGGEEILLYSGEIYERGDVSIVKEGYPIGSFYGLVSKGVDPQTGMMVYEDQNDDGEYTDADRVIIGNAQPDYIFGFNNTFSYKGLSLGILFQGVQGNDIFNATRIEIEGMENWKNQSTEVLRRWQNPGDVTDIPMALADSKQNSLLSTRFLEDGSFVRLKSVSLSYNFNSDWLKHVKISNLRIYCTGQNLLTFTDYTGYDPEINFGGNSNTALGIDFGTFPQPRTFILGVNVDF